MQVSFLKCTLLDRSHTTCSLLQSKVEVVRSKVNKALSPVVRKLKQGTMTKGQEMLCKDFDEVNR